MTSQQTAWDDADFAQAWNKTYGIDMENAPIRGRFVFPWIESHIGNCDGKRILDIGCGNGNLIRHFCKANFRELVGTDTGSAIIKTADDATNDTRVKFVYTPLEQPFPFSQVGKDFDLVTTIFVVEEVPTKQFKEFCQSIARALRISGKALIFTNHPTNALAEDLVSNATGSKNEKFIDHQGYFDTSPNQYTLRVMNQQMGIEKKAEYHHKPISSILNAFFQAGMKLQSFVEVPKGVLDFSSLHQHTPKSGDIPRFAGFVFERE